MVCFVLRRFSPIMYHYGEEAIRWTRPATYLETASHHLRTSSSLSCSTPILPLTFNTTYVATGMGPNLPPFRAPFRFRMSEPLAGRIDTLTRMSTHVTDDDDDQDWKIGLPDCLQHARCGRIQDETPKELPLDCAHSLPFQVKKNLCDVNSCA
jgi:hypothetical protein